MTHEGNISDVADAEGRDTVVSVCRLSLGRTFSQVFLASRNVNPRGVSSGFSKQESKEQDASLPRGQRHRGAQPLCRGPSPGCSPAGPVPRLRRVLRFAQLVSVTTGMSYHLLSCRVDFVALTLRALAVSSPPIPKVTFRCGCTER